MESWSNHIAIVVDGIMRQPNDEGVIIPGFLLYKSLVKDHRVTLIIDSAQRKSIHNWLVINGLTDHTREVYWEDTDPDDVSDRRIAQIGRIRVNSPLAMVYESNAEVAARLLNAGIPTFLLLHPSYTHPEFRPGHANEPTPWNQILTEVKRQQEARATDTRLKDLYDAS